MSLGSLRCLEDNTMENSSPIQVDPSDQELKSLGSSLELRRHVTMLVIIVVLRYRCSSASVAGISLSR